MYLWCGFVLFISLFCVTINISADPSAVIGYNFKGLEFTITKLHLYALDIFLGTVFAPKLAKTFHAIRNMKRKKKIVQGKIYICHKRNHRIWNRGEKINK